jgi:hypothetical protein
MTSSTKAAASRCAGSDPRAVPELDRVCTEVLAAALFKDKRPTRGVAGLFDWRSAGRLSLPGHEEA